MAETRVIKLGALRWELPADFVLDPASGPQHDANAQRWEASAWSRRHQASVWVHHAVMIAGSKRDFGASIPNVAVGAGISSLLGGEVAGSRVGVGVTESWVGVSSVTLTTDESHGVSCYTPRDPALPYGATDGASPEAERIPALLAEALAGLRVIDRSRLFGPSVRAIQRQVERLVRRCAEQAGVPPLATTPPEARLPEPPTAEPVEAQGIAFVRVVLHVDAASAALGRVQRDSPLVVPDVSDDGFSIEFLIDVRTGRIVNWPRGLPPTRFDLKVRDEGRYFLLDAAEAIVAELPEGSYVPNGLIPGEWGDYVDLAIDASGRITNWPAEPDFSEFPTVVG